MSPSFTDAANKAASNRQYFLDGMFTSDVLRRAKERYVALVLARAKERGPSLPELEVSINKLLGSQPIATMMPIATMIWFFVEFGGMTDMRAYQVEAALTALRRQRPAIFHENRQIDMHHAIPALAYCDFLVTSDKELRRYCEAIRPLLNFDSAQVKSGAEFIKLLEN